MKASFAKSVKTNTEVTVIVKPNNGPTFNSIPIIYCCQAVHSSVYIYTDELFPSIFTTTTHSICMAKKAPASDTCDPEKKNYGKIPFSNVVLSPKNKAYWVRKSKVMDMVNASVILSVHVLSLFAPFHFTWGAVWLAFTLHIVHMMFGITLSYHRNLTHQSFKLPKWLEYLFAYCGLLAMQGHPINWVSSHRFHHKYTDNDRDPHSPVEGFWFSHFNWLFDNDYITYKCGARKNVEDLRNQWYYRFLERTHIVHPIAMGFLLYKAGGFPFLAWGMGVRLLCDYHITFLVNSVCHIWGQQVWNTNDLSKNNWFVAWLCFGEGWHNNHHAFEYSARHGLEWWQLDMTWLTIMLLEKIGLAKDVKLPIENHKRQMRFKNCGGNEGAI